MPAPIPPFYSLLLFFYLSVSFPFSLYHRSLFSSSFLPLYLCLFLYVCLYVSLCLVCLCLSHSEYSLTLPLLDSAVECKAVLGNVSLKANILCGRQSCSFSYKRIFNVTYNCQTYDKKKKYINYIDSLSILVKRNKYL